MAKTSLWTFLKNLIFPMRCIFCRRILAIRAEVGICHECMMNLPFCQAYARCSRCGRPVIEKGCLCFGCARDMRYSYRKIYGAYLYLGSAKDALLRFKLEKYSGYATVFATHMAVVAEHEMPEGSWDLVVAVPPREMRMRKQGYDQAHALAKEVAKRLEIPYQHGVLEQIEDRQKQSSLTYQERRENILGNIRVVKREPLAGQRILLVDDICTTGATLEECAKMLRRAGAKSVDCSVAAIVLDEKIYDF